MRKNCGCHLCLSGFTKKFLIMETMSTTGSAEIAERSGLVADALRRSDDSGRNLPNSVWIRVHGESMLPALWPGDVVEIESCRLEDVRSGEIVLALREGRLFLHRVVGACTEDGFKMRGDSMPGPDPAYAAEALLGRLARRVDANWSFFSGIGFAASRLSRLAGMVLCHSGLVRRVALNIHDRWKVSSRTNGFRSLES